MLLAVDAGEKGKAEILVVLRLALIVFRTSRDLDEVPPSVLWEQVFRRDVIVAGGGKPAVDTRNHVLINNSRFDLGPDECR